MRIPPLSRRSLRPSPVSCYASWMFRPCGFTPLRRLSPRRSCPHCCSGSRPWGSSSFHRSSTTPFELATLPDPRDVSLPFKAFPPPIAVVAGLHSHLTGPAFPCGEALTSCPTVTPLCCTCVRRLSCLEARSRHRPTRCRAGPLLERPERSHAPGVHQPPYHLVVRSSPSMPRSTSGCQHLSMPALDRDLAVFLHRRVRCPAAVSSKPCPVLPWAWAPPSRLVNRAGEGVIPFCVGGVSTSKKVFRPAFRLRPFGFRRCRGGPKQEPCHASCTEKRPGFGWAMGNADPTPGTLSSLWRTYPP